MLPIKDLNRTLTTPHVNRLLLLINIIVFVVYILAAEGIVFGASTVNFFESNFVMTPNEVLEGQKLHTLLTSMFTHFNLLHLLGNMIYLFVFGDNIEDIFGHVGYFIFYIVTGLAASFAHIAVMLYAPTINSMLGLSLSSDLAVGVIGASGAISGVLGAYLVLFPKANVLTLVTFIIVPLPAILFLGFWFVLQWLMSFYDVSGGVAYFAHIGGFVAGMILALAIGLQRKKALRARMAL